MRSSVGFSREILNEKELKKVEILLQSGKILFKNGRFYNTNFLLADEIALFILC